ncbi:NADP-dependent 3-hydroxy acid dehydrogenase YdfG [Planctomycetales bacterium 10988]|nr:NADP-dependent 3-hydroxy acid dehydrogenase YdfG [Planctomycetales bacterium 10988]
MTQPLAGKNVVVTGGGTGIGFGIAKALAEAGAQVALAGRRVEKLQEAAAQFTGEPTMLTHAVDVSDLKSVEALFGWAGETMGDIHILVNSAGINIPKRSMAETSPENWEKVLQINATGAFYCMHTVLPQMREREDGLILNVSSIAGKRALLLGGVAYCASKFAMTALGSTAALEEQQHGIRITNIYPGEVETPILDNRPAPVSAERRSKMLQPEDLGAAALMIACLPPRAHIPEIVVKPTVQDWA